MCIVWNCFFAHGCDFGWHKLLFLYSIVLTTIDISNSIPLAWKGDKTCDDDNNNAGCDWDGGDCCGANNYKYCKKCQCRDCTFAAKSDACTKNIKGKCGLKDYVGDGVCDDQYVHLMLLIYNILIIGIIYNI